MWLSGFGRENENRWYAHAAFLPRSLASSLSSFKAQLKQLILQEVISSISTESSCSVLHSTASWSIYLSPQWDREIWGIEHTPDTSCLWSRHEEGAQYIFASMTTVTLTVWTTKSVSFPLSTLPVHCSCSFSALTTVAAVGASLLSFFHSVLCSHGLWEQHAEADMSLTYRVLEYFTGCPQGHHGSKLFPVSSPTQRNKLLSPQLP